MPYGASIELGSFINYEMNLWPKIYSEARDETNKCGKEIRAGLQESRYIKAGHDGQTRLISIA